MNFQNKISSKKILKFPDQAIIVVSFPRSGTHLFIDTLRNNIQDLKSSKWIGAPLDDLYVPLDILLYPNPGPHAISRVRSLATHHTVPIIKTHHLYPNKSALSNVAPDIEKWLTTSGHVFHIVRNPVKVAESLFRFQQSYSKRPKNDPSAWLENFAEKWVRHTEAWLSSGQSTMVKFENLITSPSDAIKLVSEATSKPTLTHDNYVIPPKIKSRLAGAILRLSRSPRTTEIAPKGHVQKICFADFPAQAKDNFRAKTQPLVTELGYEFP